MADKLESLSCDMSEIKATLEQLVGFFEKAIERRSFETVIESLEDKE